MLANERLAKEGRKFGVSIWVSTQRPAEISPTVLAQCGTWTVFRLTSEQDLRAVSAAGEWFDRQELDRIAGLPRQQAVMFGGSVAMPVRVVAPRADPVPKSTDPDFSRWFIEAPSLTDTSLPIGDRPDPGAIEPAPSSGDDDVPF
ncbi:MAG: ATP-binding protein [Bryobacterales bacterium]|nr:ATP-binding protein [Bryobacterales bacterium]